MAKPKLLNVKDFLAIGMDPKTGLPLKFSTSCDIPFPNNVKSALRIMDLQNAVNRYCWYNLPEGLDQTLIERILYFRGQGILFYYEAGNKFLFLPYCNVGTIDVYGRATRAKPVIFNGESIIKGKKDEAFINDFDLEIAYDIDVDWKPQDMIQKCVMLRDYSNGISENIIPRVTIQEPILEAMAEAYPLARTALFANSGIEGIRVSSDDEASSVASANSQVKSAALSGTPYIPIVGKIDFQELTSSSAIKTQEYLLYMQSLDSFRLSLYGLETGGLFQKKAHMLEGEMEMNAGHAKLTYEDGLTLRQRFCDIVNSIWGLGIWCDVSESALGIDSNGDGLAKDDNTENESYMDEGENENE